MFLLVSISNVCLYLSPAVKDHQTDDLSSFISSVTNSRLGRISVWGGVTEQNIWLIMRKMLTTGFNPHIAATIWSSFQRRDVCMHQCYWKNCVKVNSGSRARKQRKQEQDWRWGVEADTHWKVWHSVLNKESYSGFFKKKKRIICRNCWERRITVKGFIVQRDYSQTNKSDWRPQWSKQTLLIVTLKEMSKWDHLQVSNENRLFVLICGEAI